MTHRLDRVSIEGLRIFIPPRNHQGAKPTDTERRDRDTTKQPGGATVAARGWSIDRLMATDATLFLAVREPGIPPREFHIHRLAMSAVGVDRVMAFQASHCELRIRHVFSSTRDYRLEDETPCALLHSDQSWGEHAQ
jgi:hypothetical protein